ncbi:MAG: type II secretion system protein N, partial [Gammaproteobacteria bacterium]|nr:type II secretion system protein N [Gammaproteobacteria bacterium]
ATFVVGIAATFPARIAYDWFAPGTLRLSGIAGTVWSGQAAQGSAGTFYLHDIRWSFLPLSVFKGQLAYAISSNTASGSVRTDIGANALGTIILNNVDCRFSLQEFRDLFQLQGFEGALRVQLETLVMRDGFPEHAIGNVRLSNLLAPNISPLVIGDYEAQFSRHENGIIGVVEELSGVLDVAGTITIGNDRSYSFTGKVAALPEAPPGLSNQLRYLGSADERGHRDFRIEGKF